MADAGVMPQVIFTYAVVQTRVWFALINLCKKSIKCRC